MQNEDSESRWSKKLSFNAIWDTEKNSFLCIKIFLTFLNFQKSPQGYPTIIHILDLLFLKNVLFN